MKLAQPEADEFRQRPYSLTDDQIGDIRAELPRYYALRSGHDAPFAFAAFATPGGV